MQHDRLGQGGGHELFVDRFRQYSKDVRGENLLTTMVWAKPRAQESNVNCVSYSAGAEVHTCKKTSSLDPACAVIILKSTGSTDYNESFRFFKKTVSK